MEAPTVEELPDALPERLELVGRMIFGHEWQTPLAAALGVHRITLARWLAGKRPAYNVDIELLRVLEGVTEHRRKQIIEIASLEMLFDKRIRLADAWIQ